MNHAKLENWSVVGFAEDPYKAPEQMLISLMGEIYGHPCHEDGTNVVTSIIMHTDGREVITRNTKYVLGKAHDGYKEWYNNLYGKELNENDPFPN